MDPRVPRKVAEEEAVDATTIAYLAKAAENTEIVSKAAARAPTV